jgi:hypothetical protein
MSNEQEDQAKTNFQPLAQNSKLKTELEQLPQLIITSASRT